MKAVCQNGSSFRKRVWHAFSIAIPASASWPERADSLWEQSSVAMMAGAATSTTWRSASPIAAKEWAEHSLGSAYPPSGQPAFTSVISLSSTIIRRPSHSGKRWGGLSELS